MSKRVARAFCAHRFAFCETVLTARTKKVRRRMRQTARKMRALPVFALHPIERFLARLAGAFDSAGFHCYQDFPKSWTGFHSQRDQIVPRNQRRWNDRLVRELFL